MTYTALVAHDRKIADVRILSVDAESALGFSRLLIDVELAVSPSRGPDDVNLSDFHGSVALCTPTASTELYLGRAFAALAMPQDFRSNVRNSQRIRLDVEVDGARLEAIERLRAGSDIALLLRFAFTSTLKHADRDTWPRAGGVVDLRLDIAQSNWIKLLGRVGYAQLQLFELPSPAAVDARFARASSRLAQARQALLLGAYEDAVNDCRFVVEAVAEVMGDGEGSDGEFGRLFPNTRTWSKERRIAFIRHGLRVLAHAASHEDPTTARITWTRRDALGSMKVAAALLEMSLPPDPV